MVDLSNSLTLRALQVRRRHPCNRHCEHVLWRPGTKRALHRDIYIYNGCIGRGETGREPSQPVAKITIDPEPMLSYDRSLRDCCLCDCLQHMFKDEPRLLWVSGETRWGARNSQAYRSIVPSVNSAHISTYTVATQTLLPWEL